MFDVGWSTQTVVSMFLFFSLADHRVVERTVEFDINQKVNHELGDACQPFLCSSQSCKSAHAFATLADDTERF